MFMNMNMNSKDKDKDGTGPPRGMVGALCWVSICSFSRLSVAVCGVWFNLNLHLIFVCLIFFLFCVLCPVAMGHVPCAMCRFRAWDVGLGWLMVVVVVVVACGMWLWLWLHVAQGCSWGCLCL